MDLYTASVLIFLALVAFIIYSNRKRLEIKYGILYMWRTKRFRNTIDSIAGIAPDLWKKIGTFAIVLCFIAMALGLFSLADQNYKILLGQIKQIPPGVILPSLSSESSVGSGYILIPFWFWIIAIGAILIPHEFMHGVFARAQKIRLKSVGLLLFAIFPGAFVEPEDRDLKKASLLSKLRVFAAGSFANFVIALIFFLASAFILWPAFSNPQLSITIANVTAGSPADIAGLKEGMILTAVNGKSITTSYLEFISGGSFLTEEVGSLKEGEQISLEANGKGFLVTPKKIDSKPRIGFSLSASNIFKSSMESYSFIIQLFYMIWLFSLAVGIFNILPLHPLDGGLMFQAIIEKYFEKNSNRIVSATRLMVIFMILFSFVGPGLISA